MCIKKKKFFSAKNALTIYKLSLSGTKRFYLRTHKGNTGLITLFYKIIVIGLLILTYDLF